jgi:predicted anti-sigma-YlaC factor YlaD
VNNEIDEKVREMYEDHLYSCDQCLELYLQAVAEFEDNLPVLSNEADFTDIVMSKVTIKHDSIKKEKAAPFYQKTIFHYVIAAAMTILLMTTGVFQSITHYVETVQSPHVQEKSPSLTEGIMNKTFAWMDSIEKKNKEANR